MVFSCKTYPNNLCFTYKKTPVCVHFSSQCILELPSLYVIDQLSHVWCLIMVPTLAAHLLEQNKRVTKRSNTSVLSADKSVISRVTLTQTAAKTETDFKLWVTPSTLSCEELSGSRWCQNTETDQHALLYLHTHTHTHTHVAWRSAARKHENKEFVSDVGFDMTMCLWALITHVHIHRSYPWVKVCIVVTLNITTCQNESTSVMPMTHLHALSAVLLQIDPCTLALPTFFIQQSQLFQNPQQIACQKVGCRFKSQVQKSQLCPWARLLSEPLINALHD